MKKKLNLKYILIITTLFASIIAMAFLFNFNNNDKAFAEITTLQANTLYSFDNSPLNFVSATNSSDYSYFTSDAKGLATFGGNVHLYDNNDNELSLGSSNAMVMRKDSANTAFYYIGVSSSTAQATNTYRIFIQLSSSGNVSFSIQKRTGSSSTSYTSYSPYYGGYKIKFDSVTLTAFSSSSNVNSTVAGKIKQDISKILNTIQTDYNITYAITNGSATPNTLPSSGGQIQITPNSGYTYPDTITISGGLPAPSYTYDNSTGVITVTSVGANFSVSANCPEIPYNLTVNVTHGYWDTAGGYTPSGITQSGMSIYIHPTIYYTYPNSITFSGTANYTYNNETGVIQITNVQSDIFIDIVCEMQTITLNSGYYLLPNIKTLYDFGTINIDVPEGLKLYQYTEQSLMGRYTPTEQETGYLGGYSYVGAEPYAVYTTLDTDYISNNQTSTTVWLNNQGKLIRTIKSDNLTIEFTGFWVIYIPSNSVVGITSADFYNSLQSISNLNVIEQDLYYIIREFNNELATTATEKYNEGYAEGYDLGINTNIISDSTTSVITALFNGIFGTIFNIEIFPGFPLYILILIPIVFSMLGVIFWLIRGR